MKDLIRVTDRQGNSYYVLRAQLEKSFMTHLDIYTAQGVQVKHKSLARSSIASIQTL